MLITQHRIELHRSPEVLWSGELVKDRIARTDCEPIAKGELSPAHGAIHPIHAKYDWSLWTVELVEPVSLRISAPRLLQTAIDTQHSPSDQSEFTK